MLGRTGRQRAREVYARWLALQPCVGWPGRTCAIVRCLTLSCLDDSGSCAWPYTFAVVNSAALPFPATPAGPWEAAAVLACRRSNIDVMRPSRMSTPIAASVAIMPAQG